MSDQVKLSKQTTSEDSTTTPKGEWMNLEAAADLLGVSSITLRRHIKKGAYKARRLGKSQNAKIQVFVDLAVQEQSEQDRVSTEGFEEVLNPDELEIQDSDWEEGFETEDSSLKDTLKWMQNALTEKDAKIQELNEKLMGANYRNGYLESQIGTYADQLKLITQTKSVDQTSVEPEKVQPTPTAWQKFSQWFKGQP